MVAETHVLILLAIAGMMLLAAARDLIIAVPRHRADVDRRLRALGAQPPERPLAPRPRSSTSCSARSPPAFLLYGIALVYGATGTTSLVPHRRARLHSDRRRARCSWLGLGLLLIGFGFKVAAVPFHMWAPDVYDGAPTPITAYMAAGAEDGGVRAFVRVWLEAFPTATTAWAAGRRRARARHDGGRQRDRLVQNNLKRMLAYSSIAHAGYLLVALVAGTRRRPGLLFSIWSPTRWRPWARSASW